MKKVLSLVLVFVMIFSAMVSAAEFDFIHRTDASKNYKLKEIFKKDGALKFVALNKADYFVEIGGKYYSYQEAIEVAETPIGRNLDITAMVRAGLLTAVAAPAASIDDEIDYNRRVEEIRRQYHAIGKTEYTDIEYLPESFYTETRDYINFIRQLVDKDLPMVTDDTGLNAASRLSALGMSMFDDIEHNYAMYHPYQESYRHKISREDYEYGSEISGKSNLAYTGGNLHNRLNAHFYITLYMLDYAVPSVGHRSWVLSSALGNYGVGLVKNDTSAFHNLYAFDRTREALNKPINYPNEVFPKELVLFNYNGNTRNVSWSTHLPYRWDINNIKIDVIYNGINVGASITDKNKGYGYYSTVVFEPNVAAFKDGDEATVIVSGISNAPYSSYQYNVKLFDLLPGYGEY